MTDLPVSLSIFREAAAPYWKFVTLNIKKDMGEIIVVVLVIYVFCKIVKGIFGGFTKSIFRHDQYSFLPTFTQGNSTKGNLKVVNCVMNSVLVISI